MIKFLQKLLILWKKKKQLEEIKIENLFFHVYFSNTLENNEDELRKRLGEIRMIKQPRQDLIDEAIKIEKELTELTQIKSRIAQAEKIENELNYFIQLIKQNLWK